MRWLALVLALVPMQAVAGSCSFPTIEETYQAVAKSDHRFVVVKGSAFFDQDDWPKRSFGENAPSTERVHGNISGSMLSRSGYDIPFSEPVEFVSYCESFGSGSSCGSVSNGLEALFFLRKTEAGYEQDLYVCGRLFFPNPTGKLLGTVKRCFNGWPCHPAKSE